MGRHGTDGVETDDRWEHPFPRTGRVLHVIPVGPGPHGLAFFPQPGRYSLGHNGVYR